MVSLQGIHILMKHVSSQFILTPWSRVLLEKLASLQLVKKFLAFYGTRRFLTVLTSTRHLTIYTIIKYHINNM